MNIHEYQAKQLMNQYGIVTLKSKCVKEATQILEAAKQIGGSSWVLKAQIHAGGRGKGGGIQIAQSLDDLLSFGKKMLGMTLVTPQTGADGEKVHQVLIEQTADIETEIYLAFLINRSQCCVSLVLSREGGMDIEEVAKQSPEKVIRLNIHPLTKISGFQKRMCAKALQFNKELATEFFSLIDILYQLFLKEDLSLLEINPLVVTKTAIQGKKILPLDAKVSLDSNAQFRHSYWKDYPSEEELKQPDQQAGLQGFSFVPLDGNIGCMVNGAGLAMATMDMIQLHGGTPANFLDVGGDADAQRIQTALKFILKDSSVRGILINIFGGIVRCDLIAQGILKAFEQLKVKVPLVVRLEGNSADLAKKLLEQSQLDILSARNLKEATEKIISLTK